MFISTSGPQFSARLFSVALLFFFFQEVALLFFFFFSRSSYPLKEVAINISCAVPPICQEHLCVKKMRGEKA